MIQMIVFDMRLRTFLPKLLAFLCLLTIYAIEVSAQTSPAFQAKYKIAESRINIEYKGDTEQPKEGTANRVTIAVAKSEKVVETVK